RWWRLVTGDWIREDLTLEEEACAALVPVDVNNRIQGIISRTCSVTTTASAVLRARPKEEPNRELQGIAEAGTTLTAYKTFREDVEFTWYQTNNGWVRSDVVSAEAD